MKLVRWSDSTMGPACNENTELFKMIVGVLTACHTQYT